MRKVPQKKQKSSTISLENISWNTTTYKLNSSIIWQTAWKSDGVKFLEFLLKKTYIMNSRNLVFSVLLK